MRNIGCFYNPNPFPISSYLNEIEPNLDLLSSRYENLLLRDFNGEPTSTTVSDFCEIYNTKHNLLPSVPTCIDLMIANQPRSFKDSMVVKTGLSNFHKMRVTVMKTYYNKQKPSIVKYRKSKNVTNDAFFKDLKGLLSKFDNEKNIPLSLLKETVNKTLEKHAPFKKNM